MFLGMSLITVTELSLFISKIGWIAFSKRRRDYLYNKKKREQVSENLSFEVSRKKSSPTMKADFFLPSILPKSLP